MGRDEWEKRGKAGTARGRSRRKSEFLLFFFFYFYYFIFRLCVKKVLCANPPCLEKPTKGFYKNPLLAAASPYSACHHISFTQFFFKICETHTQSIESEFVT